MGKSRRGVGGRSFLMCVRVRGGKKNEGSILDICVYVSSAKAESIGQIGTPDEQKYVRGFFFLSFFRFLSNRYDDPLWCS